MTKKTFKRKTYLDKLKPCTKKKYVSKRCVFDIETIGTYKHQKGKLRSYAIGFYNGKEYYDFIGKDSMSQFLDFFLTHKYRGWKCYAHNGGKFDFTFILDILNKDYYKDKFKITPIRSGSRILELRIGRLNKKREVKDSWTFRDSVGLFAFPLKKLAKNFGVKTQKGDFDHEKINWRNYKKLMNEWQPYLKKDCYSLYEILDVFEKSLLKDYGVNLSKIMTISQLAMTIYRTHYMPDMIIPTYSSIESFIRESYFGGRTEVFNMRSKKANYYDVNSLYPFVMHKYKYPVGRPHYIFGGDSSMFGIFKVKVTTPKNMMYPLLPKRKDGKLLFPLGTWTGTYCTPELKKAEELGYDIEYLGGYVFDQSYLFKDYINHFYKKKQQSEKDSVDYITAKLLQNSLYGKFGQKREQKKLSLSPANKIDKANQDLMNNVYGFLELDEQTKESKSNHILPAISSFVTSYARVELYEQIQIVENIGGIIYYCDTDSLICNVELPTSDKLGDLKDECPEGIEEGYYLAPKMYSLRLSNDKQFIKLKGFPKGLFKIDDYRKALLEDDYKSFIYSKYKIATPFESLRRNKKFLSMITVRKSIQNRYDKRVILPNFSTKAVEIIET